MSNAPARHKSYFEKEIVPIMDKVMKDLTDKQREEFIKNSTSPSSVLSMAAGPDGGMTGLAMHNDRVFYTGEWNTKKTEDYIAMVKKELQRKNITVTPEIENLMIEKMVQDKIPKSSIEYISKKAIDNSLFGLPASARRSYLEDKINAEAEKRYNPNTAEKAVAYTGAAALDIVGMGGVGSGAFKVGQSAWKSLASFAKNSIKWSAATMALAACSPSEGIETKGAVQVPLWMKQKFGTELFCKTSDPNNLQKALAWAEKNAKVYEGYVTQSEKSGHKLKVGNQVMTLEQLQERQKQYSQFAAELRRATTVPEWMMNQKGIKDISTASTADLEKAERWAKSNGEAYIKMMSSIDPNKTLYYKDKNGKTHSIREADERICQYYTFCKQIDAELNKRALKNAQNNNQEAAPAVAYSAQTTQGTQTADAGQAQGQGQPQFQQMQQELQQQKFSSWGNLFKNTGLEDFINHPGMTIAMLPDMLMGMFTGKETPFGMNKGTLLPLAALFGAGFVKNPILKMILLSSAAAGILGKAATGVAQSQEQGQAGYQKYPDEKLNERISNITINGTQILMDIDGVPRSVVIPPTVADAYKQGAISENTLANAILKNYDEQSRQLAENYERQQERGVGVGIK